GDRVYGWLCLLNKLGAEQFDKEDERLAVTLAAQLAVAYENTLLFNNLRERTSRLEEEIGRHELSKAALVERSTLGSLDAEERKAHLTNSVIGDPRVPEQEWAKREKLVAFAGYPLVVDDRLVGVMAMFSCKALSDATLSAMGSVANGIALCVKKKMAEEEL